MGAAIYAAGGMAIIAICFLVVLLPEPERHPDRRSSLDL